MKNLKRCTFSLLILLVVLMFFWINRIESPSKRVLGILIVSLTSYWLGRLHGKIIGIGADGKGPIKNPSPQNRGVLG